MVPWVTNASVTNKSAQEHNLHINIVFASRCSSITALMVFRCMKTIRNTCTLPVLSVREHFQLANGVQKLLRDPRYHCISIYSYFENVLIAKLKYLSAL